MIICQNTQQLFVTYGCGRQHTIKQARNVCLANHARPDREVNWQGNELLSLINYSVPCPVTNLKLLLSCGFSEENAIMELG